MDATGFWRRVAVSDHSACWPWTSFRNERGYGIARLDGVRQKTHRYAWQMTNGPIPDGMCVLHRCDNPPCCNPAQLFLGTTEDNVADCIAKGRHAHAKLTADVARAIRRAHAAGMALRAIARQLDLDRNTVRDIVRGVIWRHAA
jgi:hypothetical protein